MELNKFAIIVSLFLFVSPLFAASECLKNLNNRVEGDSLELRYCDLQNADMSKVSTFLLKHPNIDDLSLERNHLLSAKGYEALSKNKSLRRLDVSHNYIGEEELAAIAKNTSYEYLMMSDTDIEIGTNSALARFTNLIMIDLSDNVITDKKATQLANAFLNTKSLVELKLSTNYISVKGVKALVNLKQLISLDLDNNMVRDDGAIELANTTLSWISLNGNGIGDKGAIAFARIWRPQGVIWNSKRFAILDLVRNNITDEGAYALVANQIPLKVSLNINFNLISQAGRNALENTPNINLAEDYDEENAAYKKSEFKRTVKKFTSRLETIHKKHIK